MSRHHPGHPIAVPTGRDEPFLRGLLLLQAGLLLVAIAAERTDNATDLYLAACAVIALLVAWKS